MRSWKWAFALFLLAYAIGTTAGFVAFAISAAAMWIEMFTLMPVVFAACFYQYLSRTRCPAAKTGVETARLCLLWVLLSFALDALIYIGVLPLALGARPNWHFFLDQSPWIWMSYATLFFLGYLARWLYRRRRASAGEMGET
jgi:hypothetical protein